MKPFVSIAVSAFAAAMTGIVASAPAQAQDVPQGDTANGKRLYLAAGAGAGRPRKATLPTASASTSRPVALPATVAPDRAATSMALRRSSPKQQCLSKASRLSCAIRQTTCRLIPMRCCRTRTADIYAYVELLLGPRPAKDIPALNN